MQFPEMTVNRSGTAEFVAALLAGLLAAFAVPAWAASDDPQSSVVDGGIEAAWRILRDVDCARCHGKDYDGLAAPSIIAYARTQNREMFDRIVLDGDPARGMPGYRNNARVLGSMDDIHRYFLGRANGAIGPGRPSRLP